MKYKLQSATFLVIFFLSFSSAFSQNSVNVEIIDITYDTGVGISNCGTIDFEDKNSVSLDIAVELTKDENNVVGESKLRIYTKTDVFAIKDSKKVQTIQSGWQTIFSTSLQVTLDASEFDVSGGVLYAELETFSGSTYKSCNYSIEKDEVPTFALLPENVNLSCGSSSPITFTVNNVYNSPGNLEYHWTLGSGWLYNGNPTSNLTTTNNSIQLTPYSYPPSDVNVTILLNGTVYKQLSSNITLSNFNPSHYSVTGSSFLCSSTTYSVNDLPIGLSVSSWSVSDTNVATIIENGNEATLTKKPNRYGTVKVTATLTNSCGQMGAINKNKIHVGRPTVTYGLTGNSSDKSINSTSSFHVTHIGNHSYHWGIEVLELNGGLTPPSDLPKFVVNGGQYSTTATGSQVTVFWGKAAGRFKISCKAVNNCGATGVGYKTVEVIDGNVDGGGDGCPEDQLYTSPNPVTGGGVTVNIIDPEPCYAINQQSYASQPNAVSTTENTAPTQASVKIYDLNGMEKYSGTFSGDDFTINELDLPSGMYVIHVTTSEGFNKQEILAIE